MTKITAFTQSVRDIASKPGESRPFNFETTFGDRIGEGLASISADTSVAVEGLLESVHEGILATGHASTEAQAECARCLDPVTLPIEIDFGELFA